MTRAKLMLTVQVSEMQTRCLLSPELRPRLQAAGSPASCPAPASPACRCGSGSKGLEERVGGQIRWPRWEAHALNTARSLLVLSTARSVEQ